MAASGSVDFDLRLTSVLPASDGADAANIIHRMSKMIVTGVTLGGSDISEVWDDTVDLVTGVATINLGALARQSPLSTLDWDTLKIVVWGFAGALANTAGIEVAQGASNPYFIFGTTGDKVTVMPGQICYGYLTNGDELPTIVSASAEQIDLAGTGTEQLHVILAAG